MTSLPVSDQTGSSHFRSKSPPHKKFIYRQFRFKFERSVAQPFLCQDLSTDCLHVNICPIGGGLNPTTTNFFRFLPPSAPKWTPIGSGPPRLFCAARYCAFNGTTHTSICGYLIGRSPGNFDKIAFFRFLPPCSSKWPPITFGPSRLFWRSRVCSTL